MKVIVDAVKYELIEDLGFNHSRGKFAKVVDVNGIEKIVVSNKKSGPWGFVKPLLLIGGKHE